MNANSSLKNASAVVSTTVAPIESGERDSYVEPEWGGYSVVKQKYDWGRTYTYYQNRAGNIRSVFLRKKNSTHGRRLFYLPSISNFLMEQSEKGEKS